MEKRAQDGGQRLSAGAHILVGDYCLTGVDCHFLGSDHLHDSPFVPYMTTGTPWDMARYA